MMPTDKPRARFNGWIWHLTPPASRPGFHFEYISRSLEAAYMHWDAEAQKLDLALNSEVAQ